MSSKNRNRVGLGGLDALVLEGVSDRASLIFSGLAAQLGNLMSILSDGTLSGNAMAIAAQRYFDFSNERHIDEKFTNEASASTNEG